MDKDILKSASLKATKKRILMLTLLKQEKSPVTAEYIFGKLSESLDINLSTVYRALNAMADKDILIKSIHMDGKTYYQFNDHQHKHELICSACHKSIDVEECPFEELSKALSEKTGFVITGHSMEFTGICPDCMAEINKKD